MPLCSNFFVIFYASCRVRARDKVECEHRRRNYDLNVRPSFVGIESVSSLITIKFEHQLVIVFIASTTALRLCCVSI
ncbi:hypothetical protein T01_11754 [Trichinella spiralis]|uniref:Uncharacterized protein n=1 Tax=Trichinella spiralis TaxID=6334 RepID=A0A0V1BPA9_TRISP|nr:hypothetical protein T01_11754 [Trichinella spiralis]